MATPPSQLADLDLSPTVEHQPRDESLFPNAPSGDLVIGSIARRKLLVLITSVMLAAAGVAMGIGRQPIYTAAATLQVGSVNPNSPGFYGFVQSASDLATAFSRSITAAPVLAEVHSKLGLNTGESVQRLSAEPIPLSPSFRIIATGPTVRAAVDLANVASGGVIAYEAQTNSTNPQAAALLKSYRSAAKTLRKTSLLVNRLSRNHSSSQSEVLVRAQAALDAARLRANAVGTAYQAAVVNAGPSSGLVSLLAGAVSASSDRSSKIELFGFIGLLAGLVLGCMTAVLFEQRSKRRRLP